MSDSASIGVGSANVVKVRAARYVFGLFPEFRDYEVIGKNVPSGVSRQPLSWEETTRGAENRAIASFSGFISVGIESGIFPFRDEWYNVVAVAIFDGKSNHLGYSSLFRVPPEIVSCVLTRDMEMSEAAHAVGLADDVLIGHRQGIISELTQNHVTRQDLVSQGLLGAIPPLLRADVYALKLNTMA